MRKLGKCSSHLILLSSTHRHDSVNSFDPFAFDEGGVTAQTSNGGFGDFDVTDFGGEGTFSGPLQNQSKDVADNRYNPFNAEFEISR